MQTWHIGRREVALFVNWDWENGKNAFEYDLSFREMGRKVGVAKEAILRACANVG